MECNIRNYSIFYKDGYIFGYSKYVGNDLDADMVNLDADPTNQRWEDICQASHELPQNRGGMVATNRRGLSIGLCCEDISWYKQEVKRYDC